MLKSQIELVVNVIWRNKVLYVGGDDAVRGPKLATI